MADICCETIFKKLFSKFVFYRKSLESEVSLAEVEETVSEKEPEVLTHHYVVENLGPGTSSPIIVTITLPVIYNGHELFNATFSMVRTSLRDITTFLSPAP